MAPAPWLATVSPRWPGTWSSLSAWSSPWLTPAPVTLERAAWCRPLVQDPPTGAVTDSQEEPSSANSAFLILINQLDVDVWTRVIILKILSVQEESYNLCTINQLTIENYKRPFRLCVCVHLCKYIHHTIWLLQYLSRFSSKPRSRRTRPAGARGQSWWVIGERRLPGAQWWCLRCPGSWAWRRPRLETFLVDLRITAGNTAWRIS